MNQKNAAETIRRIEGGVDVTALVFQGVRVWPLLRQRLWANLVNPKLHRLSLPEQFRRDVRFRLSPETAARLERAGQRDAVFLTRPLNNATFAGLGKLDRFMDPVIDCLPDGTSWIKLAPEASDSMADAHHAVTALETVMSVAEPFPEERIANFEKLNEVVAELCPFRLQQDAIIKDALVVRAYKDMYARVLDMLRPKAVFLACYNHPPMNGLMQACRERGIRSVDVQHGKQGEHQAAYTHWTTFPEQGWSMLPSHFWCWGEPTRKNITTWTSKASSSAAPTAIVGGLPWLEKWEDGGEMDRAGETRQAKAIVGARKGVLVTLQPFGEKVPEELIHAMRHSPPDWLWLIRPHPKQADRIAQFKAQVASSTQARFEIEKASALPLYSLFKASHCHVTAFSSSCVEALQFGLASVLWGERGAVIYGKYIERGCFLHAADPGDITRQIQRALGRAQAESDPFGYIEKTPAVAQTALQEILHTGDDT